MTFTDLFIVKKNANGKKHYAFIKNIRKRVIYVILFKVSYIKVESYQNICLFNS